jgi:acyl-CoA thioester hydrolase
MPVVAQVRVIYADTDQMGVVNNVHYLRYFEIGRCELLRSRGRTYKEIEATGLRMPVVEATLRYKQPARYDDLLDIDVATNARLATVKFHYAIRRAADGLLLCEGTTTHACIGPDDRIRRFPDELLALLKP